MINTSFFSSYPIALNPPPSPIQKKEEGKIKRKQSLKSLERKLIFFLLLLL
jgi:hypothetical protein